MEDRAMATATQAPTEIPTLAGTMGELAGRGFTEHFILVNGKLRAADSGKVFPAEGTLADAFGVYADPGWARS
jgi:hypothetical protein